MKVAIVAVTRQGAELALKLTGTVTGDEIDIYLPEGKGDFTLAVEFYNEPLHALFARIWPQYQGIICIMALGIVVRMIAPHIKDKRQDPAIVVLDEKGQFAISVLSGHWGGANALADRVGHAIGARPVITTATDVNNLPAIEMVAKEKGLFIENYSIVKKVNAAIVNGDPMNIFTDLTLRVDFPPSVVIKEVSLYDSQKQELNILITNKEIAPATHTLLLRPQNLVVGVGCRRNTAKDKIIMAIRETLQQAGYTSNSIKCLASIDIKQDEEGLLLAAQELNRPIFFYTKDEINQLYASERGQVLSFSDYVYEQLGVGGVCEAATLLFSREAKLVLPKVKKENVTVALAVVN